MSQELYFSRNVCVYILDLLNMPDSGLLSLRVLALRLYSIRVDHQKKSSQGVDECLAYFLEQWMTAERRDEWMASQLDVQDTGPASYAVVYTNGQHDSLPGGKSPGWL